MGWPVPGWSTGAGGIGRSATMLYQARGMRSSSRMNFVRSVTIAIAPFVPWGDGPRAYRERTTRER